MTQASTGRERAVRTAVAQRRVGSMLMATLLLGTTGFSQQTPLPARVEAYLNSAGRLSAEERTLLVGGQPMTKLLDADESKQMLERSR